MARFRGQRRKGYHTSHVGYTKGRLIWSPPQADGEGNKKIGTMYSTYLPHSTCPKTCAFGTKGGCYATMGHVGLQWRRLNKQHEEYGVFSSRDCIKAEAQMIGDCLSEYYPIRMHVAGDTPDDSCAQTLAQAVEDRYQRFCNIGLYGWKAFTYTHNWKAISSNAWGRISTIASCMTITEVKEAQSLGYATAMVVTRFPRDVAWKWEGIRFIPCPGQLPGKKKTCAECKMCMNASALKKTNSVIALHTHGPRASLRTTALEQAKDIKHNYGRTE